MASFRTRIVLSALAATGAAAVAACSAIWGFEDPKDPFVTLPTADGRSADCQDQRITDDDATIVFVAPADTGVSATGTACGSRNRPCSSIREGADRARERLAKRIVVVKGTYAESFVLPNGVTVEGGWLVVNTGSENSYQRACADAPGTAVVVSGSPDTNYTVFAKDLASPTALQDITIRSRAAAAPGESVYGVIALGTTTRITLTDVVVESANGGEGQPGVAGAQGAQGATTFPDGGAACAVGPNADAGAPAPRTGDAGTPGSPGTFTADGYQPTPGESGGSGSAGVSGSPDTSAVCDSCCTAVIPCSPALLCGNAGGHGCGGGAGGGGGGGGGGGSSVGIYVWDATVETVRTTVRAGNGGGGGPGGALGPGGKGSRGASGTQVACTHSSNFANTPLDGGAGTAGQAGSNGGGGGGGAGGFSYAIYKGGAGVVQVGEGTSLVPALPGAGGEPGGAPGAAKDLGP